MKKMFIYSGPSHLVDYTLYFQYFSYSFYFSFDILNLYLDIRILLPMVVALHFVVKHFTLSSGAEKKLKWIFIIFQTTSLSLYVISRKSKHSSFLCHNYAKTRNVRVKGTQYWNNFCQIVLSPLESKSDTMGFSVTNYLPPTWPTTPKWKMFHFSSSSFCNFPFIQT